VIDRDNDVAYANAEWSYKFKGVPLNVRVFQNRSDLNQSQ
jgi:hypothetical protein